MGETQGRGGGGGGGAIPPGGGGKLTPPGGPGKFGKDILVFEIGRLKFFSGQQRRIALLDYSLVFSVALVFNETKFFVTTFAHP